jgi:hypothetical protein
MMGMMGVLPMIGSLIGLPNLFGGWVVHLLISAGIGASFAVLLGWLATGPTSSTLFGAAYGMVWWVLGPLTLMPWLMGMGFGVNWNSAAVVAALPSLMGHIVYGLIKGYAYDRVLRWFQQRTTAGFGRNRAGAAV